MSKEFIRCTHGSRENIELNGADNMVIQQKEVGMGIPARARERNGAILLA